MCHQKLKDGIHKNRFRKVKKRNVYGTQDSLEEQGGLPRSWFVLFKELSYVR